MNTFKNHWAVFGFDVDSLEVGQGADSGVSTVVGKRSCQHRQVGNFMPVSNFILKITTNFDKPCEGIFVVGNATWKNQQVAKI